MQGVKRYTKKPYTLEKVGLAVKEEFKNSGSRRAWPDAILHILSICWIFRAKREELSLQPCITLADVRCYLYARIVESTNPGKNQFLSKEPFRPLQAQGYRSCYEAEKTGY